MKESYMIKKMIVVLAVLFIFPAISLADEEENKGKNIEDIKSHILQKMDKKISILNNFKSCVSSASSHDAIKSCRQQKKESMKAIKGEHKGKRKEFREDRKKRKGERRKHKRDKNDDDDKDN